MHECSACGQACDCDGEDTWFDDLNTFLNCSHDCEEERDDFEDYSALDEEDRQAVSQKLRDAH
jgi:hypothetical protein